MRQKTTRFCLRLLLLISLLCPTAAMAQRHIALVIGNADYKEAPLRNPLNDALDMAQALRGLRFEVIEVRNATRRAMLDAVNTFGARLQQAQIGLFYYSGHGMQYHGNNYLIPLQAMIAAPADLEQEAVDARRILGRMEQGQTTLNIVILDACRNNPFRNLLGFRSFGERGLAPLPRVRSSLIAYATQPDNVAEDGAGRNGTYTKHLLRYLKQRGLSLPDLFSEVGRAVLQETNGKQEPWVSFSPLPRFCFSGCNPASPPVPLSQANLPSPPSIAADYRREVQAKENNSDSVRLISISPPPGTPLVAGKNTTLTFRLGYSLKTSQSVRFFVQMVQFDEPSSGCSANGSGNIWDVNSTHIPAGQGEVVVNVVWRGGAGNPTPPREGYLAPTFSFWHVSEHELISNFPVIEEACFRFSS